MCAQENQIFNAYLIPICITNLNCSSQKNLNFFKNKASTLAESNINNRGLPHVKRKICMPHTLK